MLGGVAWWCPSPQSNQDHFLGVEKTNFGCVGFVCHRARCPLFEQVSCRLAVSRSLGDRQFKGQGGQPPDSDVPPPPGMQGQLVSPEPSVSSVQLEPSDRVVIVASGKRAALAAVERMYTLLYECSRVLVHRTYAFLDSELSVQRGRCRVA